MRRKVISILLGGILLTILQGKAFAAEFNSGQQPLPPLPPIQGDKELNTNEDTTFQPHEYAKDRETRITVRYSDTPQDVSVSRDALNIIKVPYPIRFVDTSRGCPESGAASIECIKDIGKTEYEITLKAPRSQVADLVIFTTEKTFILNLVPTPKPVTYIQIEDTGAGRKKAEETEKTFPHVELMANLLRKAIRGEEPEGYVSAQVSKIVESPDATFVLKKEVSGSQYKVVLIDALNKSGGVLQIREDMDFIHAIISRLAGSPLAVAVSREFLQPRNPDTERKAEFISTIYAVVPEVR